MVTSPTLEMVKKLPLARCGDTLKVPLATSVRAGSGVGEDGVALLLPHDAMASTPSAPTAPLKVARSVLVMRRSILPYPLTRPDGAGVR